YFPSDAELGDILSEKDGAAGLDRVVNMAKERGGHDNITGILIDVIDGNPSIEEEAEEGRRLGQERAAGDKRAGPQDDGDETTMPSKEDGSDIVAQPPAAAPPDDEKAEKSDS